MHYAVFAARQPLFLQLVERLATSIARLYRKGFLAHATASVICRDASLPICNEVRRARVAHVPAPLPLGTPQHRDEP